MTPTTARHRPAWLGNAAVFLALLLIAAGFATLQGDGSWLPASQRNRWMVALAVVLAYAGFVGVILWRSRPRNAARKPADDTAATLVVWASQTGFAQQLAERTAQNLRDAGTPVRLLPIDQLDAATLATSERALFVASTTGEGDPPDHALAFVHAAMSQPAGLHSLHYAVLALGDREYDRYCAFGHQLDDWLRRQGAQVLFDIVETDNADAGALRHWQHQLGQIGGIADAPDWTPAQYENWTLAARRELNPGSAGFPAFHIVLTPPADAQPHWQAGDIAEIRVCESPEISREYSIASLPADGNLQLLLRRMLRPDGTPGIGSGYLCDHAPFGGDVAVRIRSNPSFHPPAAERPLVLIGNGTGIAGLRALLKARIATGARRNWLLFGERNRDRDFFFGDEIRTWQRDGFIERLDLAFSRDQAERIHVQHRLRDAADTLRAWMQADAAIHVCGSLAGMAPAVDAVLRGILGGAQVEALLACGRYRRDVY
ncbi:MAG: sulfite reductase subunit alpha [Pseudoxanthomonas sp.]